jgi:hypothetical protein
MAATPTAGNSSLRAEQVTATQTRLYAKCNPRGFWVLDPDAGVAGGCRRGQLTPEVIPQDRLALLRLGNPGLRDQRCWSPQWVHEQRSERSFGSFRFAAETGNHERACCFSDSFGAGPPI